MNRRCNNLPGIAAAILVLVLAASGARAEEATSTSYVVSGGAMGVEGGVATSSSFSAFSSGDAMLTGSATSTSFSGVAGGPLGGESLASFALGAWRFYGDEDSLTPATPLADEDTAPGALWDEDPVKLRITVQEMAESGSVAKFKLQYSATADFSGEVHDVVEAWQCTATSTWCYTYGAGADNATITAKLLSDSDACSGGVGAGCGTHNESGTTTSTTFIHRAGAATEYEFTIQSSGAPMQTVYFFRLLDAINGQYVRLGAGASYPSIVTAGAELTFTVSGLPAGTSTEGVITDVETGAAEITFGELAFNDPQDAAQRLTIVTNAKAGYQVMVFGRQGLLNSYGDDLPPVTGTNASPSGWASGCSGGATGCFGYHPGDDSLAGGSARFAPNDSFAALATSSASEVAYSSARARTDVVDVVFRALARTSQAAGTYSSSVVYIVTPVF